jgi:hypothetical protein
MKETTFWKVGSIKRYTAAANWGFLYRNLGGVAAIEMRNNDRKR